MINTIGWLGAIILAISSLPQMIKTVRDGHASGLSWIFLLLWFVGEVMCLVYVAPDHNYPLIANYLINLVILSVIGYYKIFPQFSRFDNTSGAITSGLTQQEKEQILSQLRGIN